MRHDQAAATLQEVHFAGASMSNQVAARSKATVCGRSLARITRVRIPLGGLTLVIVCCQVELFGRPIPRIGGSYRVRN